jgi:DNA polymerase-3 subunit alpha
VEAARAILRARGGRPFISLADFAKRIDPKALNRRTLEQLIGAGAFDSLESNRARVFAGLDVILAEASAHGEAQQSGQGALFGLGEAGADLQLPDAPPFPLTERMKREHAAVGFYLSGHPLDQYAALLDRAGIQDVTRFQEAVRHGATHARIAGTLLDMDIRRTKSGSKIAILSLSDRSGQFEAMLFSEMLAKSRALLEPGKALLFAMGGNVDGEDVRLRVLDIDDLAQALSKAQKGVRLVLSEQMALGARNGIDPLAALKSVLKPGGEGAVELRLRMLDGGEIDLKLPGRFDVSGPSVATLSAIGGVLEVNPF